MQNKECGIGPNYVADSASAKPSKPKKAPSSSKPKAKRAEAKRAEAKPSSGGNDMSSVFAKLRDCSSCTAAGYGWCPNLRKCGGFANKKCGIGERYVSADPPPRNAGVKKARTERSQSEAPATADVPAATPTPATLLYAGPASPPPLRQVKPQFRDHGKRRGDVHCGQHERVAQCLQRHWAHGEEEPVSFMMCW